MSYKQVDIDTLKKELEELERANKGNSTRQGAFLKLEEGKHLLRILPPTSTANSAVPYVARFYHGPHKLNGKMRFYTCGDKHDYATGCPLCAADQKPRGTYLLNVVNREDGGTYVWQLSKEKLQTVMMQAVAMPEMLDPDKGYDVQVVAQGKGLERRYQGPWVISKATPVGKHDPPYNLDKIVDQGYNYQEMQEVAQFIKSVNNGSKN